jgi:hypothetical protein
MANGEELSFSGDAITEEGPCALELNANLEKLVIWGGPLTNDRLAPLSRLNRLKGFVLGEMPIDDGVLQHLKGLEALWLSNCRITDMSVDPLSRFRSLRELAIGRTGITAAGRARLRELLPQCRLVEESAGV